MNLKLDSFGDFVSVSGDLHIERMDDYRIRVIGKGLRMTIERHDNFGVNVVIDKEPEAA
jgi:hypothetical protein